jgi:hypothetical protein
LERECHSSRSACESPRIGSWDDSLAWWTICHSRSYVETSTEWIYATWGITTQLHAGQETVGRGIPRWNGPQN